MHNLHTCERQENRNHTKMDTAWPGQCQWNTCPAYGAAGRKSNVVCGPPAEPPIILWPYFGPTLLIALEAAPSHTDHKTAIGFVSREIRSNQQASPRGATRNLVGVQLPFDLGAAGD